MMNYRHLVGTAALLFASAASAGIPQLNYECPTHIAVHADEGGPVYINGKEAKLKKFNDNAYEARGAGVAITLTRNPDQSWDASYTGAQGKL
ncbi:MULTISPECIES: hypothetical protein [Pseudomonas]|uniref:Uncharacterized protein n=1 Tax=Pseudomonas fluorescens TaxID=294 RepID=A0A5E6TW56_PSEFL|nr:MULTISPECIES: hypothetical protein [Pseudomonas]VVM96647.1 hypothetical protein PS652_03071 [Pseudomonas fluorescens]